MGGRSSGRDEALQESHRIRNPRRGAGAGIAPLMH